MNIDTLHNICMNFLMLHKGSIYSCDSAVYTGICVSPTLMHMHALKSVQYSNGQRRAAVLRLLRQQEGVQVNCVLRLRCFFQLLPSLVVLLLSPVLPEPEVCLTVERHFAVLDHALYRLQPFVHINKLLHLRDSGERMVLSYSCVTGKYIKTDMWDQLLWAQIAMFHWCLSVFCALTLWRQCIKTKQM